MDTPVTLDSFRDYCLEKPMVTEEMPFGPDNLVYKVSGKMFALVSLDSERLQCNLKCDPERAIELREQYDWVKPGYHMNKKHWNTVVLSPGSSVSLFCELVDHSYALVVASLPAKVRSEIQEHLNA